MAVSLEKKTDKKMMLKIISSTDTAIDWNESYPSPEDLQEEDVESSKDSSELPVIVEQKEMSLVEKKKDHYSRHHDDTKLSFKKDDSPTLFVFQHPHRADVARRMREIASGMYADSQRNKKAKVESDMFTAVFQNFFVGTEQGIGAKLEDAPRINGRLSDEYIQSLEDAEVFIELNAAFMRVYNQDRSKSRDKNHAEK